MRALMISRWLPIGAAGAHGVRCDARGTGARRAAPRRGGRDNNPQTVRALIGGDVAEKVEKYAKIGTYQVIKFAEFLEKLRATPDGDGTLLDHSVLYWGSGMSNGSLHDRSNPPAILVGGAHGRLQGNRHIVAGEDEPTANLLLAIAHLAGVDLASIGPSTGRFNL